MTYIVNCCECQKEFEYYSCGQLDFPRIKVACPKCKEVIHKRWVKALYEAYKKKQDKRI